ncbi:MAG: hypothetical protein V3U99_06840 [Alphaproteobacteria bacterium]
MKPKTMEHSGLGDTWSGEGLFLGALFILAFLMTLKYFPGLENPAAYAGNVYQAIHPDAFPGDPYIGPEMTIWEKPLQLSLFYVLVKLGGEIWLDDRFVAVVYLGLVFASLVGIDRIVRLAGIDGFLHRLAIQLVFMRDHQILANKVFFAHQPDVNHVAFAIPVTIWLIYATLARKSLWMILFLSALSAAVSVRNAPFVIAYCLIIAAVNGTKSDRALVAGTFIAALIVFYIAVVHVFPVAEEDRLALWDMMHLDVTPAEVNPFFPLYGVATMLLGNAVFLAICLSALLAPGPQNTVMQGLRIFVGLGLATWLLAGLYFSFAPDGLKLPHIFPFTPTKTLRWPQTFAYLTILISVFHWLKEDESPRRVLAAFGAIGILLVIGPGNHELWAALFLVSAAAVVAWHLVRRRMTAGGNGGWNVVSGLFGAQITRQYPLLFVQILVLTIGVAFAATIWTRLPYWRTWAETGVFGYAGSATWIGVAEYIRENTPPDAAVLPLQYNPANPRQLVARRGLATRAGRPMPVLNHLIGSSPFNVERWRIGRQQLKLMRRIEQAFQAKRWDVAAREIEKLVLVPDYIVLPSGVWDTQRRVSAVKADVLPYAEETRVRDYVILRRVP